MVNTRIDLPIVMVWVAAMGVGIVEWFRSRRRGRGVSIIIPFRAPRTNDERVRNLEWLKWYWRTQLPGAELIIGDDPETKKAFSKSVAINRAVARSTGDVLVLVDADGFITADSLMHCVSEIRKARKRGHKLWFVPYRRFYRLTNKATMRIINSDPRHPYEFPEELAKEDYLNNDPDTAKAHWYGAVIQVLSREAFDTVGGWDERFRGWGGEDAAALRATDTLYGPHKTLPGRVLHLWHPMLSKAGSADMVHFKERMWEGQDNPEVNRHLSYRYYRATGDRSLMRKLVNEGRVTMTVQAPDHPITDVQQSA